MPQGYFIFNGADSRAMHVHVISYPPIMRPAERIQYVTIPGRSGDLSRTEGDYIYDAYNRGMEISNAPGFDLAAVRRWLRGRGTLIVGNEPNYAYTVDLGAQCQFDKVIRGVWGGKLQMHTQPEKAAVPVESDITITANGTSITNPGDVPSKPLITINGNGNISLTVGGNTLLLYGVENGWQIDGALGWIMDGNGAPMYNVAQGDLEKIKLPVGASQIRWTGSVTGLTITPRWRYV